MVATPSKIFHCIQFQRLLCIFTWCLQALELTPWARVSLCTLPAWPFNPKKFACWSQCNTCSHVLPMHKVLALFVHVVFTMWTSIALTHKVVCTVARASSRSFNDLSQASLLSLTPSVSHVENMLSWRFEASFHQVMLSVCFQGHVCTNSLAHMLSHFSEVLTNGSLSNRWTSTLSLTQLIVTQNNVEVSNKQFQSMLPASWSTNPPAGQLEILTR